MASKRIASLLASRSSGLQNLMEKAAVLNQLTQNLRHILDAPLCHHVCVANIRDEALVITADSSAWITMARYQAPEILDFVRQETGLVIAKIHFKVASNTDNSKDEIHYRQASMSRSASLLLESTAKTIDDQELSDAVARLSRRGS